MTEHDALTRTRESMNDRKTQEYAVLPLKTLIGRDYERTVAAEREGIRNPVLTDTKVEKDQYESPSLPMLSLLQTRNLLTL